MRKLLTSILVLGIVPMATGQITLRVCEADGETPFDCNDEVMVGTKLTLVVSSDSNDYWSGGLFIAGQDRALGTLAGRGLDPNDPNARDYENSHYEDAGDLAIVTAWEDSSIWGFDLYTFYPVDGNSEDNSTVTGDWFIIDYSADEVGDCNVEFYDYSISWYDPNYHITFSHVPTRDLNADEIINFDDFAIFASQWDATDCNDPNWCDGADLDRDGYVDYNDLGLFVDYWLWPASGSEPNEPEYPEDPNIIYSIVDVNGSNDITIGVNESITLYVVMETNEPNYVSWFDIEVNISDTNLGSIDNRPYDPNDPNASTARILVEPDNSIFKGWGPGLNQEEGIRLFYVTFGSPISDGNLASLVFTCEGEGDVTLSLINWESSNPQWEYVFPTLQSILIHQVDPNSQQMMGAGMGEMLNVQGAEQPQLEQEIDVDELISWLEELWLQDEGLRESISETELNEFIDNIKDLYGEPQ